MPLLQKYIQIIFMGSYQTKAISTEIQRKQIFGGSDGKESACNAGDLGLMPGLGRSPGGGNGYLLYYSGMENSRDRGAWQAIVHGVTKSRT